MVVFHFQHERADLPIGISKRCCRLCWLLGQYLHDNDGSPNFILPGTHNGYTAWVPPPGIPKAILKSLRDELVQAIGSHFGSHSRQSSGAGSDSGTDVFPGLTDNDSDLRRRLNETKRKGGR